MKALVTTSHSTIVFDALTGAAFAIERARGLYSGVARTPYGLVVAARRRMLNSEAEPSQERGCLIVLPNGGEAYTIEAPFPLRGLHGIAYIYDALWMTCGLDEQIAIFRNGEWSHWHPLGPPAKEGVITNYFTAIVERDERIYIVADRFDESDVLVFDAASRKLLKKVSLGKRSHNIWFDDGRLRVCSSAEGKLIGEDEFSLEVGEFPQGYACDNDLRILGLNQSNQSSEHGGLTSSLLLMDLDYSIIRRFQLPSQGTVLDILPITPDEFTDFERRYATDPANHVKVVDESESTEPAYVEASHNLYVGEHSELTTVTHTAAQAEEIVMPVVERDTTDLRLAQILSERDAALSELNSAVTELRGLKCYFTQDGRIQTDVLFLLRRIEPMAVKGYRKIRVGGDNDGGYVMLDDFNGVDAVFSFGISNDVSWDLQMAERGLDIFQYDHTIDALPALHDRFHWDKVGVGAVTSETDSIVTLNQILNDTGYSASHELILKCDIEDAEWDVFGTVHTDCLKQFRQIIVEFHYLERLVDPVFFHRMLRAISALTVHHAVVHIHGNNYAPYVIVAGVPTPSVVELTFVRRDGKTFVRSEEVFPTSIDMPNNPDRCDYYLGQFRY